MIGERQVTKLWLYDKQCQCFRINESLPLEANIFPMPTEVMIQDSSLRLTVLSGQPTGVTANNGTVNVMVTREVNADDGKGLPFGEAGEVLVPKLLMDNFTEFLIFNFNDVYKMASIK